MGIKLGDVSPAAALMGKDGAIKDLMMDAGTSGGMLPAALKKRYNKGKKSQDGSAGTSVQAMKKGGKVRGCGCAKRGVRKAKMY